MSNTDPSSTGGVCLSRRCFVQGLAMGGIFAVLGLNYRTLLAAKQSGPQTLRGTDFDLVIGAQSVNFTGTPRIATTVNGLAVPGMPMGSPGMEGPRKDNRIRRMMTRGGAR